MAGLSRLSGFSLSFRAPSDPEGPARIDHALPEELECVGKSLIKLVVLDGGPVGSSSVLNRLADLWLPFTGHGDQPHGSLMIVTERGNAFQPSR